MTHRRELEEHRERLGDIREILNSMKTLAYMESRKLNRFLDAQRAVVHDIELAATDVLASYPVAVPGTAGAIPVYLLIGSERGFCGDFNSKLVEFLDTGLQDISGPEPVFLATGHKLQTALEATPHNVTYIDGATVVEEVTALLLRITGVLEELQASHGTLALYVVYHARDEDGPVMRRVLPPFEGFAEHAPAPRIAPLIHLDPDNLILALTEQYVFAALHEVLYTSLMVENRRRVRHLDGAVHHLDDQTDELLRKCNNLRQEEIIEEIEVILLGRDTLAPPGSR